MKAQAHVVRKLLELISRKRSQFLVFTAIAIGAVGLASVAYVSDNHVFGWLTGGANPFGIIAPLVALGFIALAALLSRGWFAVSTTETPKGVLQSAGLASVLGIVAILLDFWIVYPKTLNVPFPVSLAYYPSIALFAEILFHLMPLTVFSLLLAAVFRNVDRGKIIWTAILLAALVDPVFQMLVAASNGSPLRVTLVTGLHVFVINLLMLIMFKRYGFVALLSFRLFYYIIWHIVWGSIRLSVLF